MENFYTKSVGHINEAFSIADEDEDDYENVSEISKTPAVPSRGTTGRKTDLQLASCSIDDDDDYENASDLTRTPAVPTREKKKKIDTPSKKEDLPLKLFSALPKPVNLGCSLDHLSVTSGTRAAPTFQPPPIGLSFSSPAVNEAFKDLPGLSFSSPAVNEAFKDLPDEASSKMHHGGSLCRRAVLVVVLILLFLMVALVTSIMFTFYNIISNQLSDIKLNVSEIKETSRMDRNNGIEDLRQVNQTFGKEINNLKSEILSLKRELGLCTSCPTDWARVGSTCYYLSPSHKTWEDSSKACVKLDSNLLILKKREKLDSLMKLIGNKRFWIGLRKLNGLWKWVDNTDLKFANWNSGEPNNYDRREHCTEMISGGWNDLDCSNTIDYICERPADC